MPRRRKEIKESIHLDVVALRYTPGIVDRRSHEVSRLGAKAKKQPRVNRSQSSQTHDHRVVATRLHLIHGLEEEGCLEFDTFGSMDIPT